MLLFARKNFEEEIAGDIVAAAFRVLHAIAQDRTSLTLKLEVTGKDFFDRLANLQFAEVLQVWQATKEEDALDQPVGMLYSCSPRMETPQSISMREWRKY